MKAGYNLDSLPGALPSRLVPEDTNREILEKLTLEVLENGSLDTKVLQSTALWRDHLALTGQIRTFDGDKKIVQVWNNQAKSLSPSTFRTKPASIVKPVPGSSWIEVPFTFTTRPNNGLVGNCTGFASFILDEDGAWKIWMLVTLLESFAGHGHPDIPLLTEDPVGMNGGYVANVADLSQNNSNNQHTFDVVVIGAGQCGLSMAGRLGALGLSYVLLEKRASIGHNWIGRYESVRQHTVREYNNLPFERTWNPTDPLLLPGKIVAEGFENYVKRYNINLWTDAETTGAKWVEESRVWSLDVTIKGAEKRTVLCRHLVISVGAGMSVDNDPKIPGTEQYQGILLHSGAYKHSRGWIAKNGIVIGSGTMAHDIAEDMYRAGLRSVHMIQRNRTCVYPIEWVIKGQSGMKYLRI